MLRPQRLAILRVLVVVGLTAFAGSGSAQEADAPATPAPDESPIYLFLNVPADLEAFWRRMTQPDFVLQTGAEYRRLLDRAKGAGAGAGRPAEAAATGIDSLAARGEVEGDLAHLTLEFGASVSGDQPTWLPIRLDGLAVTEAGEGDRALRLREVDGGWQVELAGQGRHAFRVELLAPVKPTDEGRRIDLAIPEVASTRIQLLVAHRVIDAVAASKDLVAAEPIEGGRRTRLSAHLTPRGRLELTWRVESESGQGLTPLLAARGQMAMEIEPGVFTVRSSWEIGSTRGVVRSLDVRLDPADLILELALDDQPLPIDPGRRGDEGVVRIPLAEPLRPGSTRKLSLATRRPVPVPESGGASPRWSFRGFPMANASAQVGVLAIGQGGNLWIDGQPARGLRQIDPRDIPADLRRPSTVLAYQFLDQPFELALRAEPSIPKVRAVSRSTVTVDPGLARLETYLDYQVTRGRVFELQIGLPRGLDLESAGPDEVIAASQWQPESHGAAPPDLADAPRVLTLRLTPKARDDGNFRVHLKGRQAIDPSHPVPLALFQPRGIVSGGGRLAVLTARNVAADLHDDAPEGAEGSEFVSAGLEPPADWPWPANPAVGASAPALWLRHDGNPAILPLDVAVQPRTVHHETTIAARVERDRLDVRQDTACQVRYGVLTRVDVSVPPALEGLWELEGEEVARTEPLRIEPDGRHRFRLTLRREIDDTLKLRFHYRLPLELALMPDRPTRLEIPSIEVLEGSASPPRVRVSADPGIDLEPEGGAWHSEAGQGSSSASSGGAPLLEFTRVRPRSDARPPAVLATANALDPLPRQVASRLWLRTLLGPEGDLRGTAWYRFESHESSLSVALPAGAEWIRARVGGEPVTSVERLRTGGYRLRFPPGTSSGPILVGLEYTIPARSTRGAPEWSPPLLLDGGLVQQTLWEVALPWSRAVVGVPDDWTDENRWYWDYYVWKRRPRKDVAAMSAWVGGPGSRASLAVDLDGVGNGGYHGYLFGRQGNPSGLPLLVVSRAWLVAICSGFVLGVGVLVLVRRPSGRLVGASGLALAFAVALAVHPSVTLLAVQSSMVGVGLCLLAAAMQSRLDRRPLAPGGFGESSGHSTPSTAGSSLAGVAAVGSDDSTAIRVRPGSTMDHVSSPFPAGPDRAGADGAGPSS